MDGGFEVPGATQQHNSSLHCARFIL
jgi:hypothetical protein